MKGKKKMKIIAKKFGGKEKVRIFAVPFGHEGNDTRNGAVVQIG